MALKETALRMQKSLRAYDSVGRYGGEEFLLVLPGANLADTAWLADRVRLAIRSEGLQTENGPIRLSCSFGCSAGFGGEVTKEELIRLADEALYAAKRGGRDRVVAAKSTTDRVHTPAALMQHELTFAQPEID